MTTNPTLVLGGTSTTGRRTAARLSALGVPVRVGSRAGSPPFDWDATSTWPAALRDVGAVYLCFAPDLAVPGAADTVGALARAAVEHGAERLVLLSGRGEEEARRSEEAVQSVGAATTVLRCSFFAQNFSESFLLDAVRDGTVALPVDDVREPFVDVEDVADVAVAALTEDGHTGQVYELTGPRLLTFAEATAEVATASGLDLRFQPLTVPEFTGSIAEAGLSSDIQWLLTYLFTEVLDGRNAHLTDGVQRALGRAPRDFGDYARRAAGSGVWTRATEAAR